MLTYICAFAALVGVISAQTPTTPIPLRNTGCSSPTEILVVATIPVSVSAVTVPVPICVALGVGLRLNTSSPQARLEIDPAVIPAPSATVPRPAIKVVNLASLNLPNTPGSKQVGVPLDFTPAPGSFFLISFRSSRVGNDIVDFVPFAGGDNPKQVNVLLPAYQPYEASDVLKIMYWTLEPPPA